VLELQRVINWKRTQPEKCCNFMNTYPNSNWNEDLNTVVISM